VCQQIRAICTVHELDQCLQEFTENRADFETLKLGPLVKMPLVYQFFKVPLDADICEMTTADVIECLRNYLSENNLWTTRIELDKFLQYVMDKRGLSSPYELGLRISSPALAIQVTSLMYSYLDVILCAKLNEPNELNTLSFISELTRFMP